MKRRLIIYLTTAFVAAGALLLRLWHLHIPTTPRTSSGYDPAWQRLKDSGFYKRQSKDYDGAIADFTKAIQIEPHDIFSYEQRAIAKTKIRDFDGAIADWTAAIQGRRQTFGHEPLADYYEERGAVKQFKGDAKGAIYNYSLAIQENLERHTGTATPYYLRGMVKYLSGDLHGAIDDFVKCTHAPFNARVEDLCAYVNLDIWIIQMKLGNKALADQQLTIYHQEYARRDPKYQAVMHLDASAPTRGRTDFDDVAEFLLNVNLDPNFCRTNIYSPDWVFSHHYYAGMKALFANDKSTAVDHFHDYLAYVGQYPTMYDSMIISLPFSLHQRLVEAELKRLENNQ